MATSTEHVRQTAKPFVRPPQLHANLSVSVTAPADSALGVGVHTTGEAPTLLSFDRAQLSAAGFTAEPASILPMPQPTGPTLVAVGLGAPNELDAGRIRDAAAAFALAAESHTRLAFSLEGLDGALTETAAQVAVEGMLLARYEYTGLRARRRKPLEAITLVTSEERQAAARAGLQRGEAYARATILARDLGNTPHSHLNATRFAEFAVELGRAHDFEVEVSDEDALRELNCGGLLSVNAGSAEPPCMIKIIYRPKLRSTGRVALVGKGVMYDSGGISLKPSDPVHARMKNDMSGAAAILAAVAELSELGCTTSVTAYLMCTDNMPSGTATALGDVFTTHGGKTVEVFDTDAEGRLVMCDALELAVEEKHDALIDIATLTGSCARALGDDIAGLFGNDPELIEQVEAAADATGELVWQLPLHRPYREILASDVADLRNCGPIGKPDALAAALYLSEFVGDVPWVHLDICGTAWNEKDRLWRRIGCSGFGARLLLDLALNFAPRARPVRH